jgi:LCP family protein required for cell wall assembly
VTSGRHDGDFPVGGSAFARRGEPSADDPGHELDALLAHWADERDGGGWPAGRQVDRAPRRAAPAGPMDTYGDRFGADPYRSPGGPGYGQPAPGPLAGPAGPAGYPQRSAHDPYSALLAQSVAPPARPPGRSALPAGPPGWRSPGYPGQQPAGYPGYQGYRPGGYDDEDEPDPGLLTHRASYDPDGDPLDQPDYGYPLQPGVTRFEPGQDSFYPDDDDYPPGGRHGRHRRGGGRPGWVKVMAWVVAVVVVTGAAVGGWGFYEYRRLSNNITRIDALAPNDPAIREAAKQRDAENFLLIGSDTREGANAGFGDVAGARSDTTILAHLSPNRDKALLVSFPRDSWVDLPACQRTGGGTSQAGQGMFNSAFEVGGPKCTVLTVQKLTGISVNHYVQVDFTGFQTMVDALNGVTICSTEDVFDKFSGLRLRQGNQVLRGKQALAYVRARKSLGDGSDIGRIQRQQRFLGAMIRKATGSRLLFNPLALTRFLDAATKSLTLDRGTTLRDLKSLGDQIRNLDPKKVTFITAPIANQDYAPPGTALKGKVLLDAIAGRRLWDSIINDKPPAKGAAKPTTGAAAKVTLTVAPTDVSVRVLNGVGLDGLAARTAADLTSVGFAVSNTGNGPLGTKASQIRYAPARLDAARTLAAAVPGAVLQEDSSLGRSLQLVVGSTYHGATAVQLGEVVPAPRTGQAASPTPPASRAAAPAPTINAADTRCT